MVSLFNIYLSDTCALVNLVEPRGPLRIRQLSRLARFGMLKIPRAVARELRRRDDRLKNWIERGAAGTIVESTADNSAELERISRQYADFLGSTRCAADAVVLAMAVYYRQAGWVVLTDDSGVQAACFREGLPSLPSATFRRLFGF